MEGNEVFNGFEEIKLITHNVVITCIASPINILLLEQTVGRKSSISQMSVEMYNFYDVYFLKVRNL